MDDERWTIAAIEAAEERRCTAMIAADAAALRDILAEDATWIHSSGQVDDRRTFIDKITSGASVYLTIERRETTCRLYGEVGVSGGIATMTALAAGEPRSLRNRYINVWILRSAAPRLVSAQSTKVA